MSCSGITRTVDFDTTADGVAIPFGTYVDNTTQWQSWGMTILGISTGTVSGGVYNGQTKRLMTFPSQSATYGGVSTNLINLGGGEANVLMISQNNQSPVYGQTLNDMQNSSLVGRISFQFTGPVEITSLRMIGQRTTSTIATVTAYRDLAGTITIATFNLASVASGVITNFTITNMTGALRFDVALGVNTIGHGGIARITFKSCGNCPGLTSPDCNGVCNGPNVQDCAKVCYNPNTVSPPNICDCNGTCYPRNGTPPNIPDCLGICHTNGSVPPNKKDCLGVCNGTAVEDCNGVCGGTSFVDCSGSCRICTQSYLKALGSNIKIRSYRKKK